MAFTLAKLWDRNNPDFLEFDFESRKQRRDPSMNIPQSRENLIDVAKILSEKEVNLYLLFGTALGIIRCGDLISFDTDIDTGILVEDRDKLISCFDEFKSHGFELIRTKAPDDLFTIIRNDEYVDIGILSKKKVGLSMYLCYQHHTIPATFFEKRETLEFQGQEFFIPSPKEKYLTLTYGKDWRIERRNEPAMNTGKLNILFRIKRRLVRTSIGKLVKNILRFLRS